MPFTSHDVLFVGLQRASYIAAIEASQLWEEKNIRSSRVGITYFDSTFFRAADAIQAYVDPAVIYIGNELDIPLTIRQAACRKWIEYLSEQKRKPLIVLQESCIDLVDDFATHGFNVELRPDNGTVEEALGVLITSKAAE